MTWEAVETGWVELRGRLKLEWGRLVDDDVVRVSGKRDELWAARRRRRDDDRARAGWKPSGRR